jgi:hypothetical protein
MTIACLGWGSLIWNPRDLPVRGKWFTDGPFLPVEFCRRSDNGRMTLVIVDGKPRIRTLWAVFITNDLDEAIEQLRTRESVGKDKVDTWIAKWVKGGPTGGVDSHISRWAEGMDLDAVLWTALPPRFEGEDGVVKDGVVPKAGAVVRYLLDLPCGKYRLAEEYVRKTPAQIDTDYRRIIEKELGWAPEPEAAANNTLDGTR